MVYRNAKLTSEERPPRDWWRVVAIAWLVLLPSSGLAGLIIGAALGSEGCRVLLALLGAVCALGVVVGLTFLAFLKLKWVSL